MEGLGRRQRQRAAAGDREPLQILQAQEGLVLYGVQVPGQPLGERLLSQLSEPLDLLLLGQGRVLTLCPSSTQSKVFGPKRRHGVEHPQQARQGQASLGIRAQAQAFRP